jgi:succinate dehydrogenase hydrophobic anchor subunit
MKLLTSIILTIIALISIVCIFIVGVMGLQAVCPDPCNYVIGQGPLRACPYTCRWVINFNALISFTFAFACSIMTMLHAVSYVRRLNDKYVKDFGTTVLIIGAILMAILICIVWGFFITRTNFSYSALIWCLISMHITSAFVIMVLWVPPYVAHTHIPLETTNTEKK